MITFVTCWYELHSKYNKESYLLWIDNFLSNIKKCRLVIFTNKHSLSMVKKYESSNIKIIIRELEDFHNYKYKDDWIKNHEKNDLLKDKTCWELNMLWNEKTHFVEDVYKNNIFDTKWYGWCDIGYFRGRHCDMNIDLIKSWPNYKKLDELDTEKVHYGNVNGDMQKTYRIYKQIMVKNSEDLPTIPIPPNEIFIAAGFFLICKDNISWWNKTHNDKLKLYFEHDYLVKDDQMIVLDNIVSNLKKVKIHTEFSEGKYDNWFMFQRLLM